MTHATKILQNRQRIYEEWKHFQKDQPVDRTVIRDFIFRSWVRCREKRVDPEHPQHKTLSLAQLAEQVRRHSYLIECSRVIMEKIYSMISGSRTTMVLANGEGVILRVLPEDSQELVPGKLSREEYLGTIGVGTCLEEKRQLEIFAAEHYCMSHHDFVCSAAPIFDRTHAVIGALGVTTAADSFHPHTSGMLGAAVYAISEQLHLRELLEEQSTLLELLDEGIIAIDAHKHIRAINTNAMNMLELSRNPTGRLVTDIVQFSNSTKPLIETGTPFHEVDTSLVQRLDKLNIPCIISGALNNTSGGMILTLKETGRMREFANRITGAKASFHFNDILGVSPRMRETLDNSRKIAMSKSTVLLLGESGTGKELFAQAIHNASPRCGKPFVAVNCGALPRELVQSELFGYTEGAFTGASKQGKPGKFEMADGGTIFLDEIGEMPLDVQVNLLRVLQSREVTRVGGKRTRTVDVRVIAATNKDLWKAVHEHTFREDLYYRLSVFPIMLPPLRERGEDIVILVKHFLKKFAHYSGNRVEKISPKAMERLAAYAWPGNIRELENVVERAVYMANTPMITEDELPSFIRNAEARTTRGPVFGREGDDEPDEREAIFSTLQKYRGSIKKTVAVLGMPRSTLYYKMKKYGISRKNLASAPPAHKGSPIEALSKAQLTSILELADYIKQMRG